jgi:hypothetical protein
MTSDPAGSLLVDQTLVCEASRLLRGRSPDHSGVGRNAERLFQLSLLFDAILLYDRLYVLTSDMPRDVAELELRAALVDAGILDVLDTAGYHERIAGEIGTLMLAKAPDKSIDGAALADFALAALDGTRFSGGRNEIAGFVVQFYQDGVEGDLIRQGRARYVPPEPDPISTTGKELVVRALSAISGNNVPDTASRLRTLVYWRVAAHLNLPFYPSCMRLPHYYQLINHVGAGTQDAVYGAIAESFQATVAEVYADDAEQPAYLPPALTLFLGYRRDGATITDAVGRLRVEYAPLRAELRRLQTESAQAASLGELRQAKRRFGQVLAELRTVPGTDRGAVVDRALDLVPSVAQALVNPLDVSAYTGSLLKTPKDLVRRWWLRRPYRLAFRLRERLQDLRDYADLTGQLDVSDAELATFTERYGRHLDYFRTYGPARRPAG